MKFNQWTLGLAAVGAVSLASAVRADEAKLSAVQTALSNTTISGYVDVAAQYNAGDANLFGGNTPTPGGVPDGFSLNSVTVSLDKPLDESPWASGYHIDLNWGNNIISAPGYGNVRQAYVALRTPVGNGIDWKVGLMDGITGYEGNTGYSNPNYTRSYGYALNPTTEIGLLGTYKVSSLISVTAGMVNRSGNFGTINPSGSELSSHDYIGSVALTAPDSWGFLKGSSLNLQTIQAFDSWGANNYSVNGTFSTPVTGLKVGLAYDKVQGLGWLGTANDGNVYGVYATFQQTSKLSYALRAEYVDGQNLPFFAGNGKGEEVTATVEYDLWANVVSRAEFRWDHTEQGTQFNNNNTESAYMLALNLVYKF